MSFLVTGLHRTTGLPIGALGVAASGGTWTLSTGTWDDALAWDDTQNWDDG